MCNVVNERVVLNVPFNNEERLQENEVIPKQDTPPNKGQPLKMSTPAVPQDTDSETSRSVLVTGKGPPVPMAGLTHEPRIGQLLKEGEYTSV